MEDVIALIKNEISVESDPKIKSKNLELLVKARSIEILRTQAESGTGFAMEAIGRIAASSSEKSSEIKDAISDLAKGIIMTLEKKDRV